MKLIFKCAKAGKKINRFHGRWEIIHELRLLSLTLAIMKMASNKYSKQIEVTDHHELHIVLGMVNDKEIDKILKLFPKTAHYYFTKAHIPRALNADELKQKAGAFGLKGKILS